jgi:hypothetical protein
MRPRSRGNNPRHGENKCTGALPPRDGHGPKRKGPRCGDARPGPCRIFSPGREGGVFFTVARREPASILLSRSANPPAGASASGTVLVLQIVPEGGQAADQNADAYEHGNSDTDKCLNHPWLLQPQRHRAKFNYD